MPTLDFPFDELPILIMPNDEGLGIVSGTAEVSFEVYEPDWWTIGRIFLEVWDKGGRVLRRHEVSLIRAEGPIRDLVETALRRRKTDEIEEKIREEMEND